MNGKLLFGAAAFLFAIPFIPAQPAHAEVVFEARAPIVVEAEPEVVVVDSGRYYRTYHEGRYYYSRSYDGPYYYDTRFSGPSLSFRFNIGGHHHHHHDRHHHHHR